MNTIRRMAFIASSLGLDAHGRCPASARAPGARSRSDSWRPAPERRRRVRCGLCHSICGSPEPAIGGGPTAGRRRPTAGRDRPTTGATAQQQSATAQQQAAAAAAAGKPLPLGTVVAALPPGCTSTPVGGVEYYSCGANFYRAAFQGNNLVYVTTAQPK